MKILEELKEDFKNLKNKSFLFQLLSLCFMFITISSIFSLSEHAFKLKGFLMDGINFYRSYFVNLIQFIFIKIGWPINVLTIDKITILSLFYIPVAKIMSLEYLIYAKTVLNRLKNDVFENGEYSKNNTPRKIYEICILLVVYLILLFRYIAAICFFPMIYFLINKNIHNWLENKIETVFNIKPEIQSFIGFTLTFIFIYFIFSLPILMKKGVTENRIKSYTKILRRPIIVILFVLLFAALNKGFFLMK